MGIGVTIANMILDILADYPEGIRCNEVYDMLVEKGYPYDSIRMAAYRHLKDKMIRIPLRDGYKFDGWLWKLKKDGEVIDKRFKHGNRSICRPDYISLADKVSSQLLEQTFDSTVHLCCGCMNFIYDGGFAYCEAEHLGGQAFDIDKIRKEITSDIDVKRETAAFIKELITIKTCKDFKGREGCVQYTKNED